jgi:hypothetical protein
VVQPPALACVTSHLSPARLSTYLHHAKNHHGQALQLYLWNTEMSGALQEALSIAEVFLRNTIDAQLRVWNAAQPPRGAQTYDWQWVKTPAKPLYGILNFRDRNKVMHSTYESARGRAASDMNLRQPGHLRHGVPVDHDDLVAHMTFGDWKKLIPKKDGRHPSGIGPGPQRDMWNLVIAKAFPNHPNPQVVWFWVDRLHAIRNRVAHLEPLCDLTDGEIMGYHRTVARLLRAIDPPLAEWYGGHSRVPEVCKRRPVF